MGEMKAPKDTHETYNSKFLEAVGCKAEVYDALDWSDLEAVRKKLHPQAVPRVTRLIAETEIERNPPGIAEAWWAMASTAFELGNIDGAIASCKRGIELNRGRPGVRDLRKLLERLEQQRDSRRAQGRGGKFK